MTIPFKGYKHVSTTYKLSDLSTVRIDNGVDIVSTPSESGLGSVELNKDYVNNFSGGIRFQYLADINSITIKIKWYTEDWANYDYLYVRVYDDANNKIFEKYYGNPYAGGTPREFDWVTNSFTVGVSGGYIELYLTTDSYYPSKCYVDLSTEVNVSSVTYYYNAEPTTTKGESIDSYVERYRFTKTIPFDIEEVEVQNDYVYSDRRYKFYQWRDGNTNLRRPVNTLKYLEVAYLISAVPIAPWLTFHNNFKRTGYQLYSYNLIIVASKNGYLYAINKDGTLNWKYNAGYESNSSPAVGSDGSIYFGTEDGYIHALSKCGVLKWKYSTGSLMWTAPTIGSDGTIYVPTGTPANSLYALNPDGSLKWKFTTGDALGLSVAIGSDGTIYVPSQDSYLYALNPDSSLKWKFKAGNRIRGAPTIGSDGTIYFGSDDQYIYALNPDGSLKWKYGTNQWVMSTPAIGSDGTIYVGSGDGNLYALNPNGSLKWKFATGFWIVSSPAIGSDGSIYFGSDDGYFYALNPNGSLKWKIYDGNDIESSPAVGSDDTVYFADMGVTIFALTTSGSEKWRFRTGNGTWGSPALA
jgi:outer membrane protein assembly factor BamB